MNRTCMLAVMIVAMPGLASAEFEIESATTEENAVEFEISNSVYFGDVNSGASISEHEVGLSWGVLNPWTSAISFEFTNEKGGSIGLEGLEWSNTIGLIGGEASVSDELAVAIYTAVEFEFDSDEDAVLTVGPAIEYSLGSVDLGVNTFVQVPLNGSDDIGVTYAIGASSEVTSGVEVGVEAHGEIPQAFSDGSDFDEQEHYVGPVVEIETGDSDQEAEIRLGVFAGLTEATPTVAVSANVGFGF